MFGQPLTCLPSCLPHPCRSKSSPALPTGAAGEAEQPVVAAATLLADFDSAQLLGLVPATASSRSSSSWSSSTAANGQVEPPAAAAPAWCGEHEVQQMLAALVRIWLPGVSAAAPGCLAAPVSLHLQGCSALDGGT